jgi:hypothetical protein
VLTLGGICGVAFAAGVGVSEGDTVRSPFGKEKNKKHYREKRPNRLSPNFSPIYVAHDLKFNSLVYAGK